MPSTRPEIFVFDFDGTLVQSAAAKRQAFFDIFEPAQAPAVAAVLAADPDGSRFAVVPKMIVEIERLNLPQPAADAPALVRAYGERADALVAAAPEVPGATALLREIAAMAPLYVASATPQEQLAGHLKQRGWIAYVREAFGYPQKKGDVLAALIARHRIAPGAVLVVGDGISDAEAAEGNGCQFHRIRTPADLMGVRDYMAVAHV